MNVSNPPEPGGFWYNGHMTQKHISIAIPIILLVIILGVFAVRYHVFAPATDTTPPSGQIPAAGPVVLLGAMVCLPHINTEGPQTQECAFGLKDNNGIYYALHDSDPTYTTISAAPMNVPVEVTGTLTLEKSDRYQSVGIIDVVSIKKVDNDPVINKPGSVMIGIGQSKTQDGVSITLNSIVQDNRCPIDVLCIEAGAVTANVTFRMGPTVKTFNMPSDEVPQTFQGHKISITKIDPPRMAKVQPDPNAYILTFLVDRE